MVIKEMMINNKEAKKKPMLFTSNMAGCKFRNATKKYVNQNQKVIIYPAFLNRKSNIIFTSITLKPMLTYSTQRSVRVLQTIINALFIMLTGFSVY